MPTQAPFGTPGKADSSFEDFGQIDFLLSDTPTFFTQDGNVAANQALAIYTVVGIDGSGNYVPAVLGTTEAVGITSGEVASSASVTPLQIIRGGHFNGDFLVWDATYDDDAKKTAAFEGASSPTQILIGFNKYNRKA